MDRRKSFITRYKKMKPINKTFLKLGILGILVTVLLGLPWIYDSYFKEKLIITPNEIEIECGYWDQQFPLKITNNYDQGVSSVDIVIKLSGVDVINEFNLTHQYDPNLIKIGNYQVDTTAYGLAIHDPGNCDIYSLHIRDIDAHDSINFQTKISAGSCEGKSKFEIVYLHYDQAGVDKVFSTESMYKMDVKKQWQLINEYCLNQSNNSIFLIEQFNVRYSEN